MFVDELSTLLNPTPKEQHVYGEVSSINADGTFEVVLGVDDDGSPTTTTCLNICSASVGDVVLVLIQDDGQCAAIGRIGGSGGGNSVEYKGAITAATDINSLQAGFYQVNSVSNPNFPNPSSTYYGNLIAMDGDYKSQVLVHNGAIFTRRFQTSTWSWSGWTRYANDANVMHLSGNETIAGQKTFTGYMYQDAGTIPLSAVDTRVPNMGLLRTLLDQLFVVENHSFSSGSVSANSGKNSTQNVTKSGYMPVCVAGFYTGNASLLWRGCYLTNLASGSATINWYVRNVSSSAVTADLYVRVLWMKVI